MISAKVIADSKNQFGNRITTMVVTMPRIILAEFNTHRMFSRNSASSRAIPFEKMVKTVKENPFIPIAWQKDHKGMQGTDYITDEETLTLIKEEWLEARDHAVLHADRLQSGKIADEPESRSTDIVTKQLCNRLLEPFMWHTVIVTATEWENFFALRCPRYSYSGIKEFRSKKDWIAEYSRLFNVPNDESLVQYVNKTLNWFTINRGQAEIHMMALAEAMWDAYNESTPKELMPGEWHVPFGDQIDNKLLDEIMTEIQPASFNWYLDFQQNLKVKIATARCAQVSYTVVGEEGKPLNYEKLIALHDRLAKSGHWSPFEHCAQSIATKMYFRGHDAEFYLELKEAPPPPWSGNFRGFIQYRKMVEKKD